MVKKPTVLIVIDGYGERKDEEGNALLQAKTPNIDALMETYPYTFLKTSAEAAGLEKNQAISCEGAYQQIGTGRVVSQQIKIINKALKDGSFFRNPAFIDIIRKIKEHNGTLHLIGMLSDGGIHSHINHLFALLELAQHHFLDKVFMHLFLDGRDVETTSARKYLRQLDKFLERNNVGTVATVIGRHYAMSKKPEQFKKAYEMLTKGKGTLIRDPTEAVNSAYRRNLSDEFVEPTVINQSGLIKDKDAIIFFNFRTDRSTNLIRAFTDPKFKKFPTKKLDLEFLSLVGHEEEEINCAFTLPKAHNGLSEVIAGKKMKQLKVMEEEKAEAATIWFNGNHLQKWPKEDWKIFSSPNITTYDAKPTMAANKIARYTIEQIRKNKYDFILASFANLDVLGHTGNFNSTLKSAEIVDKAVGEIVKVMERKKGVCIITSTHGNAEQMEDKFGRPVTFHTTNNVPFIITKKGIRLKPGRLADVAPTILRFLKIRPVKDFKGKSLIK